MLVRMLRGHPDLILHNYSVRVNGGGDLAGSRPTDWAKEGSKYHVATTSDGMPVACAVTGAKVSDVAVLTACY